MKLGRRILLTFGVLVSCVGCDQASKSIAQTFLSDGQVWSFLGGTLRLKLAHNQGAFLSLGGALPETLRFGLFALGVALMLLTLLAYILFAKTLTLIELLALSLLLAGGVGNLLDRITLGYVVDFINIGIGPLRTGIFNGADIVVSAGAIMLMLNSIKTPKSPA